MSKRFYNSRHNDFTASEFFWCYHKRFSQETKHTIIDLFEAEAYKNVVISNNFKGNFAVVTGLNVLIIAFYV